MKSASATILETARLRLRPQQAGDLPATWSLWSSPEVVRHISGKPSTREEAWARLLRNAGHWAFMGYGPWAVERLDTGEYIGEVGFFNLERDLEPGFDGLPEMGWVLCPAAHGQGFATEAVLAALAWADANFDQRGTACIISPENTASIRVAKKGGFREKTTGLYRDSPALLFERPRGGSSAGCI
jgi:RimJ/RimL family protein N-acetyltransferase